MARYTDADCKLCRREGIKLFLKGTRCDTPKCAIEKRGPFPPGQHGRGRSKDTEYKNQLRQKQRARRTYGVLERQFRNAYEEAVRRPGITGENLLQILESRLDNVVFRAGFALSRDQARQLVRHGHIEINGRKASIPSMRVKPSDVVSVRAKSKSATPVQHALAVNENRPTPPWLQVDRADLKAIVAQLPERHMIDTPVQEQMIVELYSK
jgi:small subunit ribosomal protein S4